MQNKKAGLILADGFEEIEAVTVVDVLRRAGTEVIVARLTGDREWAEGAHGLKVGVEADLSGLVNEELDLLVLPGGMPGARKLAGSELVLDLLRKVDKKGKMIGAICAAPMVLAKAGLVRGKRVTCYPGIESELEGAVYTGSQVEIDGRLITANGPGGALEFALTLAAELGLSKEADKLRQGMLVSR